MRPSPFSGGGGCESNSSNIPTPKFRGAREGSGVFRGGDRNMNDNMGGSGRGLPRPEFAPSAISADLNSSSAGPPIHNYRGPHRGGRRASEFMMNSSNSNINIPTSNDPPPPLFRGYGAGGVPRSPTRGGRGGFRGGGIGRTGSFSNRTARGGGGGDPRFGGGIDQPPEPPSATMKTEHDNIPAPPLFMSGNSSSNNPPFGAGGGGGGGRGKSSSMPPHGAMRRAISDGNASFGGRQHHWNRSSPHASPQYRKPSMTVNASDAALGGSSEVPSPFNYGIYGPDSNAIHPNKPSSSHHKHQQQQCLLRLLLVVVHVRSGSH